MLDRFLRALGIGAPQIPADPDERASLFRSLLSTRKTLIVLDNVRSFDQLRPLLPGGGRSVVLATSRESLGDLTGDYTALTLRLRMLEPTEATALLIKLAGADRFGSDPVAVEQLGALCDCLPLALRIAGARLAAKPGLSVRSLVARLRDHRSRLDVLSPGEGGVRAGFRLTYRDLTPEAARMYRRLGLLRTADFAAWAGAAVLDTDVWHAEELIDHLVDAQLLEVADAEPGRATRYRFQDLLRLFARERAESDEPEGRPTPRWSGPSRPGSGWRRRRTGGSTAGNSRWAGRPPRLRASCRSWPTSCWPRRWTGSSRSARPSRTWWRTRRRRAGPGTRGR